LHIGIVKLAAALNVQFAFPSSTLMIEQFPDKKSIDMNYDIDSGEINKNIKAVLDDFKGEDE